jgi:hypothetical protein
MRLSSSPSLSASPSNVAMLPVAHDHVDNGRHVTDSNLSQRQIISASLLVLRPDSADMAFIAALANPISR